MPTARRLWGLMKAFMETLFLGLTAPCIALTGQLENKRRQLLSWNMLVVIVGHSLSSPPASSPKFWLVFQVAFIASYLLSRSTFWRAGVSLYLISLTSLPYFVSLIPGLDDQTKAAQIIWIIFAFTSATYVTDDNVKLTLFLVLHLLLYMFVSGSLFVVRELGPTDLMAWRLSICYCVFLLVSAFLLKQIVLCAATAKQQFMSKMSHELRTPLNGILAAFDLLDASNLTDSQRNLVRIGRSSACALLQFINDLLDFSTAQQGRLEVRPGLESIRDVVTDVAKLVQLPAKAKGIEVITRFADNLPNGPLSLDGRILRRILLKFASNGYKFADHGSLVLEASCVGPVDPNSKHVRLQLKVTDNGKGIDLQKNIFRPFNQLDQTVSGSGLGLAYVRELTDMINGDCGFHTVLGSGSSFWVQVDAEIASSDASVSSFFLDDDRRWSTDLPASCCAEFLSLPIVDSSCNRNSCELDSPSSSGSTSDSDLESTHQTDVITTYHSKTEQDDVARESVRDLQVESGIESRGVILVADDNEFNQEVASLLLGHLQYKAVIVSNGQECIDMYTSNPSKYDAILMDCHMPLVDGYNATASIRQFEQNCLQANMNNSMLRPRIPILAVTADATSENEQRCLAAGMDTFLTKPVQMPALQQGLDVLLAKPFPRPSPSQETIPCRPAGKDEGHSKGLRSAPTP